MFKKTITVLLIFSIALSSCGKKDKSNDFVRTAPVESQESQESSEPHEPPETREPVKSLTLFEAFESRVSATCDGFAPCRYVRDSSFMYYYTYDMFHIYGVPVTPNKVVLALVGLYFTCKSFKFFGSLLIPPKFHPAPPPAPPPALVSVNVPFFRPHLSIPPFYIVLRGESGDLYWLDRQLPPWLCSSFGVHVDFRFFPSVRRGLPAPVFYIGDSKPVSTPFFTRDNDDRFVLIYPQALLPQTHLPQTQICSSVLSLPSIPEEMEVE